MASSSPARSFPRRCAFAAAVCCLLAPASALLAQAADAPLFSDGFESGSLNPQVWDFRVSGTGTATVQQDRVAHGKSALRIHYPKGERTSYAFVVASHLPDALRSHFFGRAYLFISPDMPAGHDALLSAGQPGWPISNFLEIGASGGKAVMLSYQQNAAPPVPRGETIDRGVAWPVGRWFCLEWEFNDHPDTITVWIDGELSHQSTFNFVPRAPRAPRGEAKASETAAPAAPPAPRPAPRNTDLVNGFSDFAFGFRAWGNGAKDDYDIYYDDIAIGTERIGTIK